MSAVKVVLLGDGAVGKTTLRRRFLGRGFEGKYAPTIGADFALKRHTVDGHDFEFQIWDLSGQPRFSAVRKLYYRSSVGGLVLFDVTRPETFENIKDWIQELWRHNGEGKIPIVLLGNKVDLRSQLQSGISDEEPEKLCIEISEENPDLGFPVRYLQTSAKTGVNVDEAFEAIARVYLKSQGGGTPR